MKMSILRMVNLQPLPPCTGRFKFDFILVILGLNPYQHTGSWNGQYGCFLQLGLQHLFPLICPWHAHSLGLPPQDPQEGIVKKRLCHYTIVISFNNVNVAKFSKKCQCSHNNNTTLLEKKILFDTALVMTKHLSFNISFKKNP